MYADRYAPKPLNRSSLTLSVAIVGGLVAAAMLSPTVIRAIEHPDKPLIMIRVAPPPTVPPVDPVQPKTKTKSVIDRPKVEVPTPIQEDVFTLKPETGPFVVPSPVEGSGGGGGIVIDPPKPPPPVLTGTEIDGRYARDFQPLYPPAERRAGNEGVVTVKVLIGVDGRVREVKQVAAASEEFWRVTERQALSKWRFKPATRDGIPVEAWRTMTVRFRLEA